MNTDHRLPSEFDVRALELLRSNVDRFIHSAAQLVADGGRVLDVAPQDHAGAAPVFPPGVAVETLDIDPDSGATHIFDLCLPNLVSKLGTFDAIVCTEVLEHTRQPFHACRNLFELLKPGGLVFVSTPFNFRIHGPLPDCWRFTEHGLRELFGDFSIEELTALETEDRFLMPIQYTLVARRAPAP